VAALPLPVHATKTGDAIEENMANTAVMDKKRRMDN
jgi:hypothetical protein